MGKQPASPGKGRGTGSDLDSFCRQRPEQFDAFLKGQFVSALLSVHIAGVLLCVISYFNYVKSGLVIAILPYAPGLALFIAARIWHELSPRTLIAVSRQYMDVVCLSIVLGATAIAAIFAAHDVESLNAPVQIALVVTGALSIYREHRQNYLRNGLVMAIAFTTMYVLNNQYAMKVIAQYPVGFLLGSFASYYLLQSRRAQFMDLARAQGGEAHALEQLRKTLLPHQMDRISVGDELEDTMPVGLGNAYVVTFDVAGSSQVHHDRFHEMLQRTFHDCYSIMMENYRQVPLQANGYPVKWLGDGFLCSVGFPLAAPDSVPGGDLAESLAERFCNIFRENMSELRYSRAMCCGLGIAKGTMEGFYPADGPKLYDLKGSASGDPIMLSTRYEQLRKVILPTLDRDASILVLQEAAYLSLSPERQKLYTSWEMTKPGTKVRDDPAAARAYYRLLPHVPAHGSE